MIICVIINVADILFRTACHFGDSSKCIVFVAALACLILHGYPFPGKVISTYEYKYNDQGYVVGETATELEAGTRKTPSWEDWYNWGDTQKETDKADCEHQEPQVFTIFVI